MNAANRFTFLLESVISIQIHLTEILKYIDVNYNFVN